MDDMIPAATWTAAKPFPMAEFRWPWHPAILDALVADWPADDDPNWRNHRGGKRSYGLLADGTVPPVLAPIVAKIHSPEFLRAMSQATGIADLRPDPRLEGGGLHEIQPGGRLGMHVDFNRHAGLWRRLNVLVYLNRDVPDTSGDLRLESDDGKDVRRIAPKMGTVVVFAATEKSWHGHPSPLTWDHSRRSFATYFYSPHPPQGAGREHSTIYRGEEKHGGGIAEVKTPAMDVQKWLPQLPDGPKCEMAVVTTFNRELYDATGHRLVESFLHHGQAANGPLVCCTEGDVPLPKAEGIVALPLESDGFLAAWLAANADVITERFGGRAKPCNCKASSRRGPARRAKGHRIGCPWSSWNIHAPRWFRKIAAIRLAVGRVAAQRVLWMDSDAVFLQHLAVPEFDAMLRGTDIFYLLGARDSVESGTYGFLPDRCRVVDEMVRYYATGLFRTRKRWDDSAIMAAVVLGGRICGTDIANRGKAGNVLPTSCLGAYLRHDKGVHHRSGLHVARR